ncbi:hypothetical protein BHE74_00049912 [Ensete ventricosum]|nr:hypothetical protein BHE74_00049912 [Ensete ventricosum]
MGLEVRAKNSNPRIFGVQAVPLSLDSLIDYVLVVVLLAWVVPPLDIERNRPKRQGACCLLPSVVVVLTTATCYWFLPTVCPVVVFRISSLLPLLINRQLALGSSRPILATVATSQPSVVVPYRT